MLHFDKSTKELQINRGDSICLIVSPTDVKTGEPYTFQVNDVVKFKVTEAKNEDNVVIQKDTTITEETTSVAILLSSEETKIGELINKPVVYWYEISIESQSGDVQTIIGYDKKGPKGFILNPEAR